MAYLYNIIFNEKGIPELIEEEELDIEYNGYYDDVTEYLAFKKNMARLAMEVSYAAAFRGDKFLGLYNCGKGNYEETAMPPKEMLVFLLLIGADSFIAYHNHASDILDASVNDMLHDSGLRDVASRLDLNFLDSIIICKSGTYNLREKEIITWDEIIDG